MICFSANNDMLPPADDSSDQSKPVVWTYRSRDPKPCFRAAARSPLLLELAVHVAEDAEVAIVETYRAVEVTLQLGDADLGDPGPHAQDVGVVRNVDGVHGMQVPLRVSDDGTRAGRSDITHRSIREYLR